MKLLPFPQIQPAPSFLVQLEFLLLLSVGVLEEAFPEIGRRCYTFGDLVGNLERSGKKFSRENVHDLSTFLDLNVREKTAAVRAKTVGQYVLAMELFLSSEPAFVA